LTNKFPLAPLKPAALRRLQPLIAPLSRFGCHRQLARANSRIEVFREILVCRSTFFLVAEEINAVPSSKKIPVANVNRDKAFHCRKVETYDKKQLDHAPHRQPQRL